MSEEEEGQQLSDSESEWASSKGSPSGAHLLLHATLAVPLSCSTSPSCLAFGPLRQHPDQYAAQGRGSGARMPTLPLTMTPWSLASAARREISRLCWVTSTWHNLLCSRLRQVCIVARTV